MSPKDFLLPKKLTGVHYQSCIDLKCVLANARLRACVRACVRTCVRDCMCKIERKKEKASMCTIIECLWCLCVYEKRQNTFLCADIDDRSCILVYSLRLK